MICSDLAAVHTPDRSSLRPLRRAPRTVVTNSSLRLLTQAAHVKADRLGSPAGCRLGPIPQTFGAERPSSPFPLAFRGVAPPALRYARSARPPDALRAPRQGPLPPAPVGDIRRPRLGLALSLSRKGKRPCRGAALRGVRGPCPPPFYRGLGAPAVGVRRRATYGGSPRLLAEGSEGLG